jgi:hypothetical protein
LQSSRAYHNVAQTHWLAFSYGPATWVRTADDHTSRFSVPDVLQAWQVVSKVSPEKALSPDNEKLFVGASWGLETHNFHTSLGRFVRGIFATRRGVRGP